MFKKSILELRLRDKAFFLLVAIFAIGGIYFGAKEAMGYLARPIKGHGEKLNKTNEQVNQIETKYGPRLEKALTEIQNTCNQLNNGLLNRLNKLGTVQLSGIFLIIFTLQEIARRLIAKALPY